MKLSARTAICLFFLYINFLIYSFTHETRNLIKKNLESSHNDLDPAINFHNPQSRKCAHFKKNYQKNYFGSISDRKAGKSYDVAFEPMRMHFDYTLTLPHEEKMIKELIMPPVKKFFENTLSVRRIFGKIRFPKNIKTCQDVPIPKYLFTVGAEADIIIIVSTYKGIKKYYYEKYLGSLIKNSTFNSNKFSNSNNNLNSVSNTETNPESSNNHILNNFLENFFKNKPFRKNLKGSDREIYGEFSEVDKSFKKNETNSQNNTTNKNFSKPQMQPWEINDGPADVVGWSASCLQDLYTLRPIAGVMQYVADINPTPRAIEEAIWTTLHEIVHVLAMDYDLMGDFIDENFSRKGYENTIKIKTKLVGLAEMMSERQEYMNDYFAFSNFNKNQSEVGQKSSSNIKHRIKNGSSQKLKIKSSISEKEKMFFKEIDLIDNNDMVMDMENIDNNSEKHSGLNGQKDNQGENSHNNYKDGPNKNFKSQLRMKNLNIFKNIILEEEKNTNTKNQQKNLNFRKMNLDDKNLDNKKENLSRFDISFNQGINRIFQRTINEINLSKSSENSQIIFPEDKLIFFNSTLFNKTDTNRTNHHKNTNTTKSINSTSFNNSSVIIPLDSDTINFFAALSNLFKFKRINLPVQENFVEIPVPKVFNLTVLLMYIENFSENTKIFVKTPKVTQAAKNHFSCNDLDGVELEHFGGMGSAYSHWSKRILNTEFMIADSYGENYISNFTLALLEDSGWYRVDYTKSEILPWGKGKGCEFLNDKCITKKSAKNFFNSFSFNDNKTSSHGPNQIQSHNHVFEARFNDEFCTTVNEEECSITHVFRAVCGVNKYRSDIPSQYQYFDDPKIAGITSFGDYCPYPVEWFDNIQLKPIGSCRNGISLRPGLGEKVCENCRCFISSLINENLYEKEKKNQLKNYKNLDGNRAACYEAKCKMENKKIKLTIIIDDLEIKCPRNGGILTIEGYKGFINCPKAETVCFGNLDPNMDFTNTSAYNLFSNLSEKLLNIVYEFVYSLFNK